jgi:DNA ligase D-like protein (predicted ligase)
LAFIEYATANFAGFDTPEDDLYRERQGEAILAAKVKPQFIQPMLLLRTERLPEGPVWVYEIKLDGYRALAFKARGQLSLRSRNDNDFAVRYLTIAKALSTLPNDTAVDGESVALDEAGKPSFNSLQNYGSSNAELVYYLFDVMVLAGKDVTTEPLAKRRVLLATKVLPYLAEPIRSSPVLEASPADLIQSVKAQGFEGLVVKRLDSQYQPGLRTGAWQKMRVNQGQELVIAGYTRSSKNFDALVIGYYEGGKLMYAARTRHGFTPASRAELFKRLKPLEIAECPFANLPEKKAGRWGAGLTAEKMKECRWLKPKLVGQFEFVEWTDVNHLRHTKFVALLDDKKAKDVVRES